MQFGWPPLARGLLLSSSDSEVAAALVTMTVTMTAAVASAVTGLQRALEIGPDHPFGVATGDARH
jgi:hypothetical protein